MKGNVFGPPIHEQIAAKVASMPHAPMRLAPHLSASHSPDCSFRIAETCAIPIECEHGYDVCPKCDPCTCAASPERTDSNGR